MILPLSTLLGSNYFQLRIFAVSDKTPLSNNPCWLSLPSTGPVLPRTPVNFLHPQHLTSICCLLYDEPSPFTCCEPVSDYFPLILLVCGLDGMINRQSPPTPPVSLGFCRPLLNCPDLFFFFLDWNIPTHLVVPYIEAVPDLTLHLSFCEPFPAVFLLLCTSVAMWWHYPCNYLAA